MDAFFLFFHGICLLKIGYLGCICVSLDLPCKRQPCSNFCLVPSFGSMGLVIAAVRLVDSRARACVRACVLLLLFRSWLCRIPCPACLSWSTLPPSVWPLFRCCVEQARGKGDMIQNFQKFIALFFFVWWTLGAGKRSLSSALIYVLGSISFSFGSFRCGRGQSKNSIPFARGTPHRIIQYKCMII